MTRACDLIETICESSLLPAMSTLARSYSGKAKKDPKSDSVIVSFPSKGKATEFSMEVEDAGYSWDPTDARTIVVHPL